MCHFDDVKFHVRVTQNKNVATADTFCSTFTLEYHENVRTFFPQFRRKAQRNVKGEESIYKTQSLRYWSLILQSNMRTNHRAGVKRNASSN